MNEATPTNRPYNHLAAATALVLAGADLNPSITGKFVPQEGFTIDVTDKDNPNVKALLSQITDKHGMVWALGERDQNKFYYPVIPDYLYFSYGNSTSRDKGVVDTDLGNLSRSMDTSVEVWGHFADVTDRDEAEFGGAKNASELTRNMRGGRAIVYALQWNQARGQDEQDNGGHWIMPHDRRLELDLVGTGVGVHQDSPTSPSITADQRNSPDAEFNPQIKQESTKRGLLEMVSNLSNGVGLPSAWTEEQIAANKAFWERLFTNVRESRTIQGLKAKQDRGEFDHKLTALQAVQSTPVTATATDEELITAKLAEAEANSAEAAVDAALIG